eukprot:3668524-Alexandrium_andersonii.AAC.1
MSASLVGSEMCIRDRLYVRRRSTPPHEPSAKGPVRAKNRLARYGRPWHEHCLLYTSDAADDM